MSNRFLCAVVCLAAIPISAFSTPILYGGNGGHPPSTNNGALVTVNQNTAAVSVIGTPSGVSRLTGIAFDSNGVLYGSTITGGGFPPPPPTLTSSLVLINPTTGALINNVGPIRATTSAGPLLSIADLAVQPGTNTLYGIEGPDDGLGQQGDLWTINKSTGVASLVGNTGVFFGSIAFAPNGSLYLASAQMTAMGGPGNPMIGTINPATGARISSIATTDFFGALAVRPTDNVIFGDNGDAAQLFTINPNTGAETLVGSTGSNFIGGLGFAPVPEPSALGLLAIGIVALAYRALRPTLNRS